MNAPDKQLTLDRLNAALADALRPQVDVTAPKPTCPTVTGFVNIGELTIQRMIGGVLTDLFSDDAVRVEAIVEVDGVDDPGRMTGAWEDSEPPSDADRYVFSAKPSEPIPMNDKNGDEVYVIGVDEELKGDLTASQIDDIKCESWDFEIEDTNDYESMRGSYDY